MFAWFLAFFVFPNFAFTFAFDKMQLRVVGGNDASIEDFPYQASLRSSNRYLCGGSIISNYCILTAAHCVYGGPIDNFTVVVGTSQLTEGGQVYDVGQTFYHTDYISKSLINDIAVLLVTSPITFGPSVQPISLSSTNPPTGVSLVLTGWGLTSFPGTASDMLQEITLTSFDLATCAQKLKRLNPVTVGNVCTISPVDHGSCQGDSGGPLVEKVNGVYSQVGIVSWGLPCAKGLPDVFTSVAYYRDWILHWITLDIN
ncbi:Chymotrypsin-1 [Pseudolycoriella hygida]|uniref:Chymotrypsin-1 n=1 Tax=Pseudolycoriella hygida TaxID=35572 RepID=A0A9Q0N4L5_9DIPT|nr:Chymotrypsin-1 [Pseudolycoriella hygida]